MTTLGPDMRLRALAADLTAGRYKVLSLDVFDTLIWRRVPEPADIFYQVGRSLKDADLLAGQITVTQFAHLRVAAAKAARAKAEAKMGSREVLLVDIYAALPEHIWRGSDSAIAAITREVAIEAESMVLDRGVVDLM
ncbi:MAG: haloacid dehalogenase, partial [Rhodospirillaceae bacterium]|nr:haloacid dehalogenase [Rhodospirillaceae bacterium]